VSAKARYSVPKLSVEQLWELRNTLLENAKRLTDDAELLLANARWPAAFESAYFAREETAKSMNMFAVAHAVAENPAQLKWPEFWSMWKDHKKKSAIVVMTSRLYERLFESPEAAASKEADTDAEKREASELMAEREAALYVHWDRGIRTPWGSISEGRARQLVGEARKMVDAEVASTNAHRALIDAAGKGDVA
jgi:AbiV family abortive infection protein